MMTFRGQCIQVLGYQLILSEELCVTLLSIRTQDRYERFMCVIHYQTQGWSFVRISELNGGILKSSRAETSHEKCFLFKLIIYAVA
jgi:hypothetical protein